MKLIPLEEVNKIYRKIKYPSDELLDFYDDIWLIKGIDPIATIDTEIKKQKNYCNFGEKGTHEYSLHTYALGVLISLKEQLSLNQK